MSSEQPVLAVRDLAVHFSSPGGTVHALDGVSLKVFAGEIVAVVGESGCGKTTLARAVLGLQRAAAGRIELNGEAVNGTSRDVGKLVGMVWQDPYASLDPRWQVGASVLEPVRLTREARDTVRLFPEVGLDPSYESRYPHQLSGGQRQRVAIARALALRPPLVICDEPTAALDLSIRAQILNLLKSIQAETKCAFLYISHDLMTVRFLADRIAVMYMGRIVESGPTERIFSNPRHPYTAALLESAPTLDRIRHLPEAPMGELPDPRTRFAGCRFAPRCPNAGELCKSTDPAATESGGRSYFCHFPVGA